MNSMVSEQCTHNPIRTMYAQPYQNKLHTTSIRQVQTLYTTRAIDYIISNT